MASTQTAAALRGAIPLRCPACQAAQMGQPGSERRCSACGAGFRVLDQLGRCAPLLAGGLAGRIGDPPSQVRPAPAAPAPAAPSIACPHCQRGYPLMPTLLGRTIRCAQCKGVFQVDGAGAVTPFQAPAATSTAAEKQQQSSQHITAMRRSLNAIAAQLDQSLGGQSRPLSQHISQAGEAISKSGAHRAAQRLAKAQQTRREAGERRHVPALSGNGTRAQRQRRGVLIAVAVTILLAIGIWALQRPDPVRRVLIDFDNPGNGSLVSGVGERERGIEALVLHGGQVLPIAGVSDARLASRQRYPLADLAAALGELRPVLPGQAWAPAASAEALRKAWEALPAAQRRAPALSEALLPGVTVVSHQELLGRIRSLGPHGAVLAALIGDGRGPLAAALAEGRLPTAIELQPFGGRKGQLPVPLGDPVTVPYRGLLVRLEGKGWPAGWKVFNLQVDE